MNAALLTVLLPAALGQVYTPPIRPITPIVVPPTNINVRPLDTGVRLPPPAPNLQPLSPPLSIPSRPDLSVPQSAGGSNSSQPAPPTESTSPVHSTTVEPENENAQWTQSVSGMRPPPPEHIDEPPPDGGDDDDDDGGIPGKKKKKDKEGLGKIIAICAVAAFILWNLRKPS